MKTYQDILALCAENEIEIIDFKMIDIVGRWRHLSIPAKRFTEDTLIHGIGFDGSNYGYAPVENSDMVFIPDLDTAVVDCFTEVPTLSMNGDVMVIGKENKPFDQYPRNVARRAEAFLRDSGIADAMMIAPEYEYYVFDDVQFQNRPDAAGFQIYSEEVGWSDESGFNNAGFMNDLQDGYHIALPRDIFNDLRSRSIMTMADWGIEVKYHHHEVGGAGQMEIEVELGEMMKMADATMIAKYIVKNEALAEGLTATFMPKPIAGMAGNGMHVHMMLTKDGRPLFYDENGYGHLSETALYFIGGLLEHARSLCAITNPTTNSYKRLIPGFEAPVTIGYAMANRSAVVRIPAYAKDPLHKRFELRNPDATCNPYYAFSAILMAGLDGIEKKIDPHAQGWGPFDCNLYDLPEEEKAKLGGLPTSLSAAAEALRKDHEYLTKGGVFPQRLIDLIVEDELREDAELARYPHPKEFAMYYDL